MNAPVLKTGIPFGVSRVRIPPPPLAEEGMRDKPCAMRHAEETVGQGELAKRESLIIVIRLERACQAPAAPASARRGGADKASVCDEAFER